MTRITLEELSRMMARPDIAPEDLAPYFIEDTAASDPFAPAVALDHHARPGARDADADAVGGAHEETSQALTTRPCCCTSATTASASATDRITATLFPPRRAALCHCRWCGSTEPSGVFTSR